jgi:cysteine desulfurase
MEKRFVYLDHAAASPLDPRVRDAMQPWLGDDFGNPQSLYSFGAKAKDAVERARQQVAQLIGAGTEEIIFTASGSESNNHALKGIAAAYQDKGRHLIVSAIEHSSVLNVARGMEKQGFAVTWLPVDGSGLVNPDDVRSAIRPDTILISVMTANNEVGTIQPVAEIGKLARAAKILLHTDAVAAAGLIPLDVNELNVDALTLAAPTFSGPKGAGALYVRKGTRIKPLIEGGVQENSRRAGSENTPAIVGMGLAAELAARELPARASKLQKMRDRLLAGLPKLIERVYVTGHPTQRLPNHASFCVEFIEGEGMLLWLDDEGIYAASGSACTSRTLKESYVLISMGLDHALAQGSLMLTLGVENSGADVECFLEKLPPIVEKLRRMSPLYAKYRKDPQGYEASRKENQECTVKK